MQTLKNLIPYPPHPHTKTKHTNIQNKKERST